ncbi:MAG: hypothetical protein H6740_15185 [Alphaproteobacteria bacterium]|nr:hypothetical protein [Alphaproteobacteria bacterium]
MISLLLALVATPSFAADSSYALGDGLHVEGSSGDALTAKLLVQERVLIDPSADSYALSLPVLRPDLIFHSGSLPLTARVQTELAGANASLLDAYVELRAPWGLSVRSGRFLIPSCRQQLTPVPLLVLQGFAPSADAFRHGRDLGVQFGFQPESHRVDLRLGAFDGPFDDDGVNHVALVGRAALNLGEPLPLDEAMAISPGPLGVTLGASGQLEPNGDRAIAGVELAARASVVSLTTEAFMSPDEHRGGYAQLAAGVWPDHLLLVGRVDRTWDTDLTQSTTQEGLVWMIRPAHAFKVGVAHKASWAGEGAQHQLTLDAQLRL